MPATAPPASRCRAVVAQAAGPPLLLNATIDGTLPRPSSRSDRAGEPRAAASPRSRKPAATSASRSTATATASASSTARAASSGATSSCCCARATCSTRHPGADDHRRREGEPDAVRRDRASRRQAVDVEDRPLADQDQDDGDRRAAGRRDERPHLLRRRASTASTTRSMPPFALLESSGPRASLADLRDGLPQLSTRRSCASTARTHASSGSSKRSRSGS